MRLFLGDPLGCSARVLWQGRDITPADRRLVTDDVGYVAGDQRFMQIDLPGDRLADQPLRRALMLDRLFREGRFANFA